MAEKQPRKSTRQTASERMSKARKDLDQAKADYNAAEEEERFIAERGRPPVSFEVTRKETVRVVAESLDGDMHPLDAAFVAISQNTEPGTREYEFTVPGVVMHHKLDMVTDSDWDDLTYKVTVEVE